MNILEAYFIKTTSYIANEPICENLICSYLDMRVFRNTTFLFQRDKMYMWLSVPDEAIKMSADVPMLNDNKKSIVKRRMLQTFLGGLQLRTKDAPWWFVIPQLVIFLIPALLSIPFTILLEYGKDNTRSWYILWNWFTLKIYKYF